jgi:RNA polymerase sigma factor (sigma-70 family)
MRHRREITEMFSTFAQLERDRFSNWVTDIKLLRSIKNCLKSSPEVAGLENFWALYWHKDWCLKPSGLARMHLLAYLQEPCYWAAQKAVTKFANSQYSMADYFQMANGEVETILKFFSPEKSSNLKSYAIMAIPSRLRDILRRRQETDVCSDWALLRKVSKRHLLKALDKAGLSQSEIAQYRLAWACFKELYVQKQPGGTKALPEPTPQLWEAIANLYNKSRQTQLAQSTKQCEVQTIKHWLNRTVLYVRTYLFPPVQSLNAFLLDNETNLTLDLPDPDSDSPIADLIAEENLQERHNQISQMFTVLLSAFQTLDKQSQEVLKLYYQQELTQQQIMQQLHLSQPTVSRKLVKSRESMLTALVKWCQGMNISVNPVQIKDMSVALEEWLRNQFGDFNTNP